MPAPSSSDVRVPTLVHTHGTRLVRLAHLLDVPEPELVAADALAATLSRRGSDDAHEELMTAAHEVGARAQPPIHDDIRLQGWLDRAELDVLQVDLMALQTVTVQRMAVQRAHHTTRRRRMAAAGVAAVALLVGASLLSDGDQNARGPAPALPTGSLEGYPPSPVARGPVAVSGLLPSRPRRLPPGQRAARGFTLADTFLAGRTVRVTPVHVRGAPATIIAVQCAPHDGSPSLCAVAVPPDEPLRQGRPKYLLATLPLPTGDRITSTRDPLVSRSSFVDEFDKETVLWAVASARVERLRVEFTDGRWANATRYSHPTWDVALFVIAAGERAPVELTYLTDGRVLERRFL